MSINLSLLKKIRCRFLDRSTGRPVPGVVASLSIAVGDEANSAQLPVATLCADVTGYMSFDLKLLIDKGMAAASGLFISAPKFGLTNYDLLRSLLTAPHDGTKNNDVIVHGTETSSSGENKELPCIVFPIYLENRLLDKPESESASCEPTRLPSIQSPDICDYKVSPYSFVTPAALKLGNDCCEILLPSSLPIQQHRFYRVIVRLDDTDAPAVAANTTELPKGVDVTSTLRSPAPVIKFGEVLEYLQEWYSVGHSLGEIKYSLPLAPGESTQLAVIEWSRSDLASRIDSIRATEFLDHDLRRDRAIEDTVDAALREEQGGNSHFGGTSGTASGQTYGTGMWTGNHAFGGGISYSYGKRNLEGESLQDIHDRVRQASSSVRSLNSTVIVQGSQAEGSTLQTRRVANHNHCHALTIQYYEVLRHYRMTTRFSGRRQAVLIPFTPFTFTQKSWEIALRFRAVLEQTLLDPSLKKCFEALIRLNLASSVYDIIPKPSGTSGNGKPEIVEVEESVTVAGDKEPGVRSGIKVLKGDNFTMNASGLLAVDSGTSHGSGGFGPGGDGQTAPTGGNFPFIAPGLIAWSLIYKIGLADKWRQGPTRVGDNVNVTADRGGEIVFNVNSMSGRFRVVTDAVWTVNLKYPSHEAAPTPKDQSTDDSKDDGKDPVFRKTEDELCSARLLRHLQDNQGYYNSAVWMLMDSFERRLYLEAALVTRPDILAGMDDRPLAISGNYVAFQYSGPLGQFENERVDDPAVPYEDIVTLPTRGLFAEAQMGHCNSCEKRDVTRNSDWTEMITETPPEISGITPGPKGTAPSITPGQLPSNVIQITQPQGAPDPTALANALGVLKTPDIFRDMAGFSEVTSLVGRMVEAATDANIKAMGAQAQARLAELQANAQKGSGSGGGSSSSGGQTPSERYDNLQVAKEVANAADQLGLTEQQKGELTKQILGDGTQTGSTYTPVSSTDLRAEDFKYLVVVSQFKDLITFPPPTAVVSAAKARGFSMQPIAGGIGDVNLDQYTVRITKLPNDPQSLTAFSETGFFEYVRRNFPKFLQPFPRTGQPESLAPFSTSDTTLWGSNAPLGTVLQFTIDPPMSPGVVAPLLPERGLVLCTEYSSQPGSDHHWNFSTMSGPNPAGSHPVSGTRQFGLRAADGFWFFYIRASDRMGGYAEWALSSQVYEGQDIYWKFFQAALKKFVDDNGGTADTPNGGFVAHVPWDQVQRIIARPAGITA